MVLLFASQFATGIHPLAFGLLLAATACLGIGFGFAVPALNTFTAAFFPKKVGQAILTLNALLGVGTALAPIFAAIFVGLGVWWGLPILMSGLTLALILFSLRLPLKDGAAEPAPAEGKKTNPHVAAKMPARFWLYAGFALLYGICETMNGNWATVYMSTTIGASIALSSMALTVFLGHGNRRSRSFRRDREMVPGTMDVPRPTRFAGAGFSCDGRDSERSARPCDPFLRAGRAGMLRAASAGH